MSMIFCKRMSGKVLMTKIGAIRFDVDGNAQVADENFAKQLAVISGYSLVEEASEETPEEITEENTEVDPESENNSNEENKEQGAQDNETIVNEENLEEQLNLMSIKLLEKYAQERNIDLGKTTKKAEIIELILSKLE